MPTKSKVHGAYISPAMRKSREAKRKAAAAKRKKDLATKAKADQATKKKAIAKKVGPTVTPAQRKARATKKAVVKKPAGKKKLSSFGSAFAAARKAGKKAFTWRGKSYHTRTKEEEAKRKKK